MASVKAKADKVTSSGKRYSLFVGRWQPWHKGHRWLIDQRLELGKNVCVAIRDVEVDDKNPFTAEEVKGNVEKALADLISAGRVKVVVIPDIESINYGRNVGYDIIEHDPPPVIADVSASKIRKEMGLS